MSQESVNEDIYPAPFSFTPQLQDNKRGRRARRMCVYRCFFFPQDSQTSLLLVNKVVIEKMFLDTWTCSAFFSELNACRYFFSLTKMSHKGSNPQELVIGIVFREAAGTQGAINYKYRQI